MRRPWILLLIALALVTVGLAAGATVVLLGAARSSGDFRRHLAAHFVPRPDCPVPEPFVETHVDYDCSDGHLPSGRPITLILGAEPGSRATVWNYIGVFIPGADPTAIAPLVARVRARGDWWGRRQGGAPTSHLLVPPPETEPVRAESLAGGALVVWRLQTLPSVAKLESRLADVDATIRAAP